MIYTSLTCFYASSCLLGVTMIGSMLKILSGINLLIAINSLTHPLKH